MRIVKVKGGLGNQMFQYAYARLVQKMTTDSVKLDYTSFNKLENDQVRRPRVMRFNLQLPAADAQDLRAVCRFRHKGNSLSLLYKVMILLESKINHKYFLEPDRAYIEPDRLLDKLYYDGYWQSWRYIAPILDDLRRDFTPKEKLSAKTLRTQQQISEQSAVFVGVRKGDYADEVEHYGSFGSDYYQNAIKIIERFVKDPVYYVFSNDILWCKKNIDWNGRKVIYREPEDQTDDFEELMLMASCKHAIIVNSTYNWWGATLIPNPEKVVCCPQKWFFDNKPIDITPEGWIRVVT